MRFLRYLVVTVALVATALLPSPAQAQSLAIGLPSWQRPETNALDNQINRNDCREDAKVTFSTTFVGVDKGTFELWAGSDCSDANRNEESTTCVHVANGDRTKNAVTVDAQDLVKSGGPDTPGPGAATVENCDDSTDTGGVTRSLHFLVISDGKILLEGMPTTGAKAPWEYTFDSQAPAAPTSVKAGAGEASLVVDFETPGEENLHGFRFYCAPTDSGTVEDCSAAGLMPGMEPGSELEKLACGSVQATGVDSAQTSSNLMNGVAYAVAVASEDNAGNVGVLSDLACSTPKEVTGFYEAYRAAGGEAGGGFCTFAPARRGAAALSVALLLGLAACLRRRR
jgi:hypothetical protein